MAILREISTVASIKMPIGENWTVSRCRYAAKDEAGKRVCIATGVHGDEMMGQLVVYDVAQRIMKQPENLHGTIDVYPMINPLGLDIGERMVPSGTRLDMNRAFPGSENGTAMENICYHIVEDMKGADLVLDVHTSSQITSSLYCARIHESSAKAMVPETAALCPEVIWVLPDRPAYNATLTGALTLAGTKAIAIEMDERRLRTQMIVDVVVEGIFCKLHEMGVWTGKVQDAPALADIPCMLRDEDMCRVTCKYPGMFVPVESMGAPVKEGSILGTIFDALSGEPVETVVAPAAGLVFVQRRYSVVYPGTLIARICKKESVKEST